MATNLGPFAPGTPDNTFEWLLHSSGGTLSPGFQVGLGDGTNTGLWLDDQGIGIKNPFGLTRIRTLATDDRSIDIPDQNGTYLLKEQFDTEVADLVASNYGGKGPAIRAVTTVATAFNTAGGVRSIAGLTGRLRSNTNYFYQLQLILTKLAGVSRPRLAFTSGASAVYSEIGRGMLTTLNSLGGLTVYGASGLNLDGIALNTAAGTYYYEGCGVIFSGTVAADFSFNIDEYTASTGYSVGIGSSILFTPYHI